MTWTMCLREVRSYPWMTNQRGVAQLLSLLLQFLFKRRKRH